MSNDTKGNLEKIILAGIGALAKTGEKSKEMLDELVKKGELTVAQGKTLNEELKHTIKTKLSPETGVESSVSDILQNFDKLSAAEIAALKAKLAETEETGKNDL